MVGFIGRAVPQPGSGPSGDNLTDPFEHAAAAHQRMETGHHSGKIILTA